MLIFVHDYETTGVNVNTCGVVQSALCFVELNEDGTYTFLEKDVQLLNPGHPIPEGASGVHGIYDHHVEGAPNWLEYLSSQFEVVNDTDVAAVAGYNSNTFDNRIAARAGLVVGRTLDLIIATRRMKNAGKLPGARLGVAYEHLTGRPAEGAHDAMFDVCMTLDLIIPAMEFAKVGSVSELMEWMEKPGGSPSDVMPYGKHKGVKLCNLPKSYVRWALDNMNLEADLKAGLGMVL